MKQCMDDREFEALKELLGGEFGLSFRNYTKENFAKKLLPRLEQLGLKTFSEYLIFLKNGPEGRSELYELTPAIMNTESYFLREFEQYRLFVALLHDTVVEAGKTGKPQTLNILSAGCACGQEPFSLSILLRNYDRELQGWRVNIFAIDVNQNAIEKAQSGSYHAYSFRNNNSQLVKKYFSRQQNGTYKLDDDIIAGVQFRQQNLLRAEAFRELPLMDFIFCRNLLIYMTPEAEGKIAQNFWHGLSDCGYLFLGQSESFRKQDALFKPVRFQEVTVYQKKRF